ncbi:MULTISPECIES: vWA domain-containing protein [Bifidobacterium]|uniref:vWA domain-containing protein n=1 Tax=Bifidobacterium TaxID=1678 RepID=UPI001BDC0783|nr:MULTISPECIES: vWA domain-containing protein [Bifidobacterium]MBT1161064.1 VWA domain-containing protein [Bifidobacterium sp. SO1]MBW3078140.1 VWA domain-containing protein [Bifidobacterium simiiventris]
MTNLTFSPALGWPAGIVLTTVMMAFAAAAVIVHVRHRGSSDETVAACVRRVALCVTLAVMALTPSIVSTTTSQAVNATDVVIAVDVTGSMAVADAHYGSDETISRLDAAKRAVADITAMYPDASFMGLRFGSSGTVDVPLTPDARAIGNWANTLGVEATSVSAGSSLDAPLDQLLVNLKAMHESRPDDAIIVYLISDGEETGTTTRRSYSTLRKYVNDGFTVGVGSTEGGRIPVIRDGADGGQTQDGSWVTDPDTGQPGISRMDETNLRDIADELSGSYLAVNATTTMAEGQSKELSSRWQVTRTVKERTRATAVVWPLALLALVLLAWETGSWLALSRRLI